MKPSLAEYRSQVVLFSLLLVLCAFLGTTWFLAQEAMRRGEEGLRDRALFLSREVKLLFESQEAMTANYATQDTLSLSLAADLLPKRLSFLGVCAQSGQVDEVFKGPPLGGLFLSTELLAPVWRISPYLSIEGIPMLTFALPFGDRWLLAGFDIAALLADLDPSVPPSTWGMLVGEDGNVFVSWNDRGMFPQGTIVPLPMLEPRDGVVSDIVGDRAVWVRSWPILHGVRLVGGLWRDALLEEALKQGGIAGGFFLVAAVLLLTPLLFGFSRLFRDFHSISGGISSLDWDIRHMPDPLVAIDNVRREWGNLALANLVCFRDSAEVVRAFQGLFEGVATQGQEIAALYEETAAMQSELESSNRELRSAMERLEELGLFSQAAVAARSTKEAAVSLVHSITAFGRARAGGVVLLREGRPVLVAFDGDEKLEDDLRAEMEGESCRFGEICVFRRGDVLWHFFPISYLGSALGVVCLAQEGGAEDLKGRVQGIMALFVPHLGGILRAHLLVEDVRRSYHYLALRFQGLSATQHEETASHLARMRAMSLFFGRELGLGDETLEDLAMYSMLHDIGKLKVPREILSKPGPLDSFEFAEVKCHAQYGVELLGDSEWLSMARDICLYHHEKWDGSGYPHGLAGDAIPIAARIVALADVYDALRSPRCYKAAMSHERACSVILKGDGRTDPGHFDPRLLDIFRERERRIAEIFEEASLP